MACYSQDFTSVLAKNLLDKDIEIFWYNYKNFILNTYRNNFDTSSDSLIIANELELFSGILNEHQSRQEWSNIIIKIRNFQMFLVLFLLASFKRASHIELIKMKNSYILLVKFFKRWNNISMLSDNEKIPLNWHNKKDGEHGFPDIVKIGVAISMICRNLHERKCNRFMHLVKTNYIFNQYWWSKDNFEINDCGIPVLVGFITRSVIIFLFDDVENVDASTGALDYIVGVYDFKKWWFQKNHDKTKINYNCEISTKKFCVRLRNVLKMEDF